MRIGAVPYLNVRPLIYGIEHEIILLEPGPLADRLRTGELDVGLVPVAEVLAHDAYDILDGVAIAARGAVESVFVVHREPLPALRRVAVSPVSRTSVWLLRVLLKRRFGIAPEFYPRPPGAKLSEHEAMLLIGDDALWYAQRNPTQARWDLGQAWVETTGLPFVFAVWAFRREIPRAEMMSVAARLRRACAEGLAHLEDIVQNASESEPSFLRRYYRQCVWYELGESEKAGLRRFQEWLAEEGLIPACHDLRFIP